MSAQNVLDSMALGEVNAKGFIDDKIRDEFFRKLRSQTENRTCFDCPNRNPTWISLSHGTFVCLECSGEHRRKGVHISFVRSADMDSFTPAQIATMSVGGNGKARDYFKSHGMGRTSESGKPVDYNSNAALRFRQQIEKEAQEVCKKIGATCKASAAAAEITEAPKREVKNEPTADDFFNFESQGKASAAPPPQSKPFWMTQQAAPGIPQAQSTPNVTVVRRTEPEPTISSIKRNSAPVLPGKGPKATTIDFDFDFDELEKEASMPPPAPAPAPEPTPAPAPASQPVQPVAPEPVTGGYPKAPVSAPSSKFAGRKSLGSDDFFGEFETASEKQERANQYNRFAGQGAISSDAFFGREQEQQKDQGTLSSLFSAVSSASSEFLNKSMSKGSDERSGMPMVDGISSYMNRRSGMY